MFISETVSELAAKRDFEMLEAHKVKCAVVRYSELFGCLARMRLYAAGQDGSTMYKNLVDAMFKHCQTGGITQLTEEHHRRGLYSSANIRLYRKIHLGETKAPTLRRPAILALHKTANRLSKDTQSMGDIIKANLDASYPDLKIHRSDLLMVEGSWLVLLETASLKKAILGCFNATPPRVWRMNLQHVKDAFSSLRGFFKATKSGEYQDSWAKAREYMLKTEEEKRELEKEEKQARLEKVDKEQIEKLERALEF